LTVTLNFPLDSYTTFKSGIFRERKFGLAQFPLYGKDRVLSDKLNSDCKRG